MIRRHVEMLLKMFSYNNFSSVVVYDYSPSKDLPK